MCRLPPPDWAVRLQKHGCVFSSDTTRSLAEITSIDGSFAFSGKGPAVFSVTATFTDGNAVVLESGRFVDVTEKTEIWKCYKATLRQ